MTKRFDGLRYARRYADAMANVSAALPMQRIDASARRGSRMQMHHRSV